MKVIYLNNNCRALIGIFTADNTRRCLADNSLNYDDGLDKFTVKKYYTVDLAKKPFATLGLVSRMLDIAPFVMVVNTGRYMVKNISSLTLEA